MMTASALGELIRCAEDAGIIVISDEIYHGLDYAFAAECAARISSDAIIVNSFSKYFCMTGWRIGWMVVPPPLVRAVERLQQNLAISVPTLAQIAAEAAFDGRAELEEVRHGYEENRRILLEGLPRAGPRSYFCRPTARFIFMPTFRGSRPTALPLQRACWRRRAWRRPRGSISTRVRGRNYLALLLRRRARGDARSDRADRKLADQRSGERGG